MLNPKSITAEHVREYFDYAAQSGELIHRARLDDGGRGFNAKYAGVVAGFIDAFGYRQIRVGGSKHRAHRLVFLWHNGFLPVDGIDHINGMKGDNRIENLRAATPRQNSCNRASNKNNKTGVKGVCVDKRTGRYKAAIRSNGKLIHLGYFDAKEDAAAAYRGAVPIHHGTEFGRAS